MALHLLAARAATPPALTTTFAPSPSCTIDIYNVADTSAGCVAGTVPVACHYFQLGVTTPDTNCFPSGWAPSSTAFFSPGVVCPQGYTTACSNVATVDGGAKETRATCCPSAYSCQTASDFPWFTTDLCVYAIPDTITVVYTSSQPGVGYVTSSAGGGGQAAINAYGVEIRFQSSDLAALTTSSSSSTASPSSSGTGPSSTPNSSSATATGTSSGTGTTPNAAASSTGGSGSPSPDTSTGLSTGAKAGIGIGAAAAVLILAGAAVFLWRRSRRRNGGGTDLPGNGPSGVSDGYYGGGFPPSSSGGYASPEGYVLPGAYGAVPVKPELSDTSRYYTELAATSPATARSHELSNEAVYTEMAA